MENQNHGFKKNYIVYSVTNLEITFVVQVPLSRDGQLKSKGISALRNNNPKSQNASPQRALELCPTKDTPRIVQRDDKSLVTKGVEI